jgi:hypothetical protein
MLSTHTDSSGAACADAVWYPIQLEATAMHTVRILILAAVATTVLTGCRSGATPGPAASGPTPTAVSTGDNGIYALPANEIAACAADAVDTNSFVRMKTTPAAQRGKRRAAEAEQRRAGAWSREAATRSN